MRNLAKRVAITVLLAVGSSPAIADAIDGEFIRINFCKRGSKRKVNRQE